MKFKNFSLRAEPIIQDAYCNCGNSLSEVADGFLRSAWFCHKCESLYTLKLIKVADKRIAEGFLEYCRKKAQDKK